MYPGVCTCGCFFIYLFFCEENFKLNVYELQTWSPLTVSQSVHTPGGTREQCWGRVSSPTALLHMWTVWGRIWPVYPSTVRWPASSTHWSTTAKKGEKSWKKTLQNIDGEKLTVVYAKWTVFGFNVCRKRWFHSAKTETRSSMWRKQNTSAWKP